jgi:glycosyltransferase involved in cell wall biosynthesis
LLTGCLNLLPHIDPSRGGLSSSLPPFCASTTFAGGFSSSLAAFCGPTEHADTSFPVERLPGGLLRRGTMRQLSQAVRANALLHIHGLWEAPTLAGGWLARKNGVPYIVSAHGMLEPWALRNKRWKKSIYAAITERSTLARAVCLRALTRDEAENYRQFGLSNSVAIVPNGVAVRRVGQELFLNRSPELRGRRVVLYLGRIHQKKGPDILVRAWQRVAKQFPDAQLVIAGPDSGGAEAMIQRLASQSGVSDQITFTGHLAGDAKWSALAACTLFVLPSHSEGFSVAVLEALGCGKPVMISPQCHFPEVAERRCGWIVEPACELLAAALANGLQTPDRELQEMGERGQALVSERYCWDAIGRQMAEVYRWVLGGPKPQLIEVLS